MESSQMENNKSAKSLEAMSLWELRDWYEAERQREPRFHIAQVAFALAVAIHREAQKLPQSMADAKEEYGTWARDCATNCRNILANSRRDKQKEVATEHPSLAGVVLPAYFYYEYVMQNDEFRKVLR